MEICKAEQCQNKPNQSGKGYCRRHYDQIRKYGHILNDIAKGNRNKYIIKEDYAELHILDKEGNTKTIALVDKEDVEKLKQYSFRNHNRGYLSTSIKGHTAYIHQIVYGKVAEGKEIDHINRNKLDNRKANLRECSHIDNMHNRKVSLHDGVNKLKRLKSKPYLVRIKNHYLGYYATLEEAQKVRDEAEKLYYKEYRAI